MLTPPPDSEIIEWPTSRMWFQDGIVYAISKKGDRSLEETKEMLETFKELVRKELGDEKVCLLIDVTNSPETPRDIRDYAAEEFPKIVKAIAMISESALGKMVANLFFTIKTQPYPTRFFNSEKEAKKWLQQYL
ncbi:MAG: STAS/SEC14 domain-containing protein [Balneolaceae bacterium]